MGNAATSPKEPVDPVFEKKQNALDKKRIEEDDLEYVMAILTPANLQLEVVPRVDGVGCQYTPLGWAILHNARQITTYIINMPNVDVTRHVAWWYENALPDTSLSSLVERVAPKLSFSKTLNSINGLDLAVILGNVEIVEEILKLPLAWTRKFHDPLNWALFWASKFYAFAQGKTEGIESAPRKIQKSEEEAKKYEKIIELLKAEGATDDNAANLDPIWEQEHSVLSIYPPKELITIVVKPVTRKGLVSPRAASPRTGPRNEPGKTSETEKTAEAAKPAAKKEERRTELETEELGKATEEVGKTVESEGKDRESDTV